MSNYQEVRDSCEYQAVRSLFCDKRGQDFIRNSRNKKVVLISQGVAMQTGALLVHVKGLLNTCKVNLRRNTIRHINLLIQAMAQSGGKYFFKSSLIDEFF